MKPVFASEELVSAMEENLFSLIPVFGRLGEMCLDNPPGVRRSITPVPMPLFNSIVDARLQPQDVDKTVQVIQSDARRRKVPVLWWTGPSSLPANLGCFLEKYGFQLENDAPGMAVELSRLDESRPVPEGLSIQLCQDETSWRQWGQAIVAGYELPPSASFLVEAWTCLFQISDPHILQAYLGTLNGEPVATSLLNLGAGVAGIYGVGTAPAARRKGIGAWLTLYPLLQARAAGFSVGILQSTAMGVGVYRSLGFQEHCRIRTYRWRP